VLDASLDRTFDGTLDGPRETDRVRVDTTCGKETEIANILGHNAERGLPGCLGSLDCSHWQ